MLAEQIPKNRKNPSVVSFVRMSSLSGQSAEGEDQGRLLGAANYNRNDSNLLNVLSGVGQGECGAERSQGGGRTGLKIGYCFPL